MTEQKKIRVRIAVAVNENGQWYAYGDCEVKDERAAERCRNANDCESVHFIEATVPLPQPQDIEGEVADG